MRTPRGANEAFALTLVDEIVRLGVRHACVSPGSRSGPFALAFAHDERIQTHVHHDERSAAFFALGIAKATGVPAAVLTTSGTAAANVFPAIVEARHSLTPLLVLTADRPPELRATGANQTIDQIKMYGDSVVWFAEAGTPEVSAAAPGYWRSLAARAVTASLSAPGPVHLNLALRDPLYPDETTEPYPHPIEGRPGGAPWTETVRDDRASGVAALPDVERGLIVAGTTGTDLRPLLGLAESLGWPLLAEPTSNLRVPGTVSTYDALLRSPRFVEAHAPEVVVRVGKLSLGRPLAALLRSTRQIAVSPHGAWLDEHRSVERMVVADIASISITASRKSSGWRDTWLEADAKARTAIDETIDGFDEPSEAGAARDLAASIPDGSNLFVASSMPIRDLESFMRPREGLRVFANRGANGIDGAVSTTLGIAATRSAPTYALLGDIALLHDSNGLLYDQADVTFVVINNDGGGIFSFLEQANVEGFERVFGTPHGRNLEDLARFHGIPYTSAGTSLGLPSGPGIVEVRTDRARNVEQHRAIWAAVESAL